MLLEFFSAGCKDQGNFQDHFSGNIPGPVTQIPDLTSVLPRVFVIYSLDPSLRHLQSNSQKMSLSTITSWWLLFPLTAPPTVTDLWTDLNAEKRLVFLMATDRQQGPETPDLWLRPLPAGTANDRLWLPFSLKDFRVSSPWVGMIGSS
jgi:hypothetical protein